MDRLLMPQRNSSGMDVEPTSGDVAVLPNPIFAEIQLRRESRRASENKLADLRNSIPATLEQKACNFCSQLIIVASFDQHLIDCPQKLQPDANNQLILEEDTTLNRHEEQSSNQIAPNTSNNDLQLVRSNAPVQSTRSRFFNLFRGARNSPQNSPRIEPSEPRLPNPFSLVSSLLGGFPNPLRNHPMRPNQPRPSIMQEETTQQTNNQNNTDQQTQQTQAPNTSNIFPNGAILVRTIQPGPDGTVMVMMRVIPLSGLFGQQEENREPEGPHQGLFGALLNMLIGIHGTRGDDFAGMMNLFTFPEEKGLEKEAIDSLPIVKYNSENFKNVDDELKKCPICLDQFEEEQEIRFLWCLHRFHRNCVDQWLDKHTNCPICKKDYNEAVKDSSEMH